MKEFLHDSWVLIATVVVIALTLLLLSATGCTMRHKVEPFVCRCTTAMLTGQATCECGPAAAMKAAAKPATCEKREAKP
mgnify:CR=1 FL=1